VDRGWLCESEMERIKSLLGICEISSSWHCLNSARTESGKTDIYTYIECINLAEVVLPRSRNIVFRYQFGPVLFGELGNNGTHRISPIALRSTHGIKRAAHPKGQAEESREVTLRPVKVPKQEPASIERESRYHTQLQIDWRYTKRY
jgi:hypothetical protein